MHPLTKIAERKIREAIERGELTDLPGQGQPLVFEDDRGVPEDLRLAYKILKNADCLPPELMNKKEIARTEELLDSLTDEQERLKAIQRLNFMVLKLNEKRHRPVYLEESQRYFRQVVDKVGRKQS